MRRPLAGLPLVGSLLLASAAGCTLVNDAYDGSAGASASEGGPSSTGSAGPTSGSSTETASGSTSETASGSASASTSEGTGATTRGSTSASTTTTAGTSTSGTTTADTTTTEDPDTTTGGVPRSPCSGSWSIGEPEKISITATEAVEDDPVLLADGKTLLFLRWKGLDADSIRATRPTPDAPFNAIIDDDQFGLKSMYNEFHVELSDDGLRAYLAATRDKSFGVDVFTASRPDTASSFGSLSALFAGTFDEHDPHVTGDELRIYYAIYQVNDQELWTATRASVNDPFGDAVPLDAVNLPGVIDANPSVSRDQRVLVFASMRSGEGDVYVSVRDEPDLPWGPPSLLPPGVNTMAAFDGEPFLAESTGKCELFFASDREAEGNHDLYRVDIEVTD